jgi:hypothetical protein
VHACPKHSELARIAEEALHKWETKRIKAINAWITKNPPPRVPPWMEDIIP